MSIRRNKAYWIAECNFALGDTIALRLAWDRLWVAYTVVDFEPALMYMALENLFNLCGMNVVHVNFNGFVIAKSGETFEEFLDLLKGN